MNIKSYTNIGSEFLKSEFSDNTAKLSLKTISLDLHFLSCGGDEGGREKRNAGSQTQPSDLRPVLSREAMGDCSPPEPISLVLHTT